MEIVKKDGSAPIKKPAQQINIDLSSQPNIQCEECDGIYFEQVMQFKKVSKLLTGAQQDQIAPIQVFLCKSCGTPCKALMPEGIE